MNAKPIRLVCATDLSVRAGRAADVAAVLTTRLRGRLTLVHAVQPAGRGAGLVPVQGRLLAEAGRLRAGGLDVDPVLLRGFPAGETLLDFVRKDPPALVIVASAVKSPLDRWAFGSVAEQIAQASTVPTLVVRAAEPFERWQPKGPGLKVFVAVDLYATSDGVLKWVRALRRAGPCDVTVCHVNAVTPPPGSAAEGELANPPKLQARLEREVRKKVRDVLGDDEVRVVVQPARFRPGARIVGLARTAGADLIVIGTHQRRGLSRLFHASLSRSVLHEAETNVACVPLRADFDPRDAHLPEYRRVLVATDFSELGNAAVPHACGACAIGGLVRLVHVIPAPATGGAGAARKRDEARARLAGLVPAEMGARGQPPEVEVIEHEDPATALCAEADRFGADLVCLASHGLGGSKAIFGSVTQRVLKMLRRPILIVRRPDE